MEPFHKGGETHTSLPVLGELGVEQVVARLRKGSAPELGGHALVACLRVRKGRAAVVVVRARHDALERRHTAQNLRLRALLDVLEDRIPVCVRACVSKRNVGWNEVGV